jgi:protein gp37
MGSEMAENTKIEWADHTFNPWRDCSKVSSGCANCYADTLSKRNPGTLGVWGPNGTRVVAAESMWRQPEKWDMEYSDQATAAAAGMRKSEPERPRVFCASLADVFEDWKGPIQNSHGDTMMICPNGHIDGSVWEVTPKQIDCSHSCGQDMRPVTMADLRARLFRLIDETPNLDWLLVTKRPENIVRFWPRDINDDYRFLSNVWLLTSVEDQAAADRRIPELLKCRDLCPVLGLSMEPLLGPVDLEKPMPGPDLEQFGGGKICQPWYIQSGINWIIAGGESGPGARPMHPDWVRSIRDQCESAGVPFFLKQWGEWVPTPYVDSKVRSSELVCIRRDGSPGDSYADGVRLIRVGKKAAGRILDGRTWDQFPEVRT